jgi:hypothetical protein
VSDGHPGAVFPSEEASANGQPLRQGCDKAAGDVPNPCRVGGDAITGDPGNGVERFGRPCYPHVGGGMRCPAASSRSHVLTAS